MSHAGSSEGVVALDTESSIKLMSDRLSSVDIARMLQRVSTTDYKDAKRFYSRTVFPFFQQMSSIAYRSHPKHGLRLLWPDIIRVTRTVSRIKGKETMYEHIKIGSSRTPSAVVLWVPSPSHVNCIIAVRGSATKDDFIADARAWHKELVLMNANSLAQLQGTSKPVHPTVHGGFHDYHVKLYAALMPRVLHSMTLYGRPINKFRFYFTGHSLGSVSTVMASALSDSFKGGVFAFSFGGPYLGSKAFNDMLVHPDIRLKRYFRIYNRDDLVVMLRGLQKVQHVDGHIMQFKLQVPGYHAIDVQDNLIKALGPIWNSLSRLERYRLLHRAYSFDGKDVYS